MIYKCKPESMSDDEARFTYIVYNFPDLSTMEIVSDCYVNRQMSLPEIKLNFGIDFKSFQFLLRYWGIPIRGISDASPNSRIKCRKTLMETRGVKNISQLDYIKEKKALTFLKNYGVDNIFKTEDFKRNLESYFLDKYSISRSEYLSKKGKEIWGGLDDQQKRIWLKKSIFKMEGLGFSQLEERIARILMSNDITYEHQFFISHFSYDFRIGNFLLEIHGDFWHANPLIYKSEDVLPLPGGVKLMAKEIWEKDKIKAGIAKSNNFTYRCLWEYEIKKMSDEEILEKINYWKEKYENQIN